MFFHTDGNSARIYLETIVCSMANNSSLFATSHPSLCSQIWIKMGSFIPLRDLPQVGARKL